MVTRHLGYWPNALALLTCLMVSVTTFNVGANELSAEPANQAPIAAPATLADVAAKADELALAYHEMGWFSGTLLLAQDGVIFHTHSLGWSDSESRTRAGLNTRYNLGSIIKNFTKVLVLRAVERGTIGLDETLDQFELGFSADYQSAVTVAHLLDHRSGFNDIFVAEYREDPLAFESLQSKLDLMRDTPLRFDPGTDRLYSNYNYIVLGAILEKRSGRTFETLLDKEILEPLRLNDSALQADPALTHQSTRYTYRYHNVLSPVGITEHPSPDGGLESTVVDVWRFYRSLFHSDVLINDKTLLNKHNFQYPEGRWRAYGGGLGISAAADIDLERDIEIIVLTNSDKLVAEEISNRLHAFWTEGAHAPVRQHPVNFAYEIFERSDTADYCDALSVAYEEQDYRPFIGRTLNTLGIQLLDNHREEAAMAQFQCLAQRFPSAPQAWDSLAMGYERTGDMDQARVTFEKALAIDVDFQSDYSADNYAE